MRTEKVDLSPSMKQISLYLSSLVIEDRLKWFDYLNWHVTSQLVRDWHSDALVTCYNLEWRTTRTGFPGEPGKDVDRTGKCVGRGWDMCGLPRSILRLTGYAADENRGWEKPSISA